MHRAIKQNKKKTFWFKKKKKVKFINEITMFNRVRVSIGRPQRTRGSARQVAHAQQLEALLNPSSVADGARDNKYNNNAPLAPSRTRAVCTDASDTDDEDVNTDTEREWVDEMTDVLDTLEDSALIWVLDGDYQTTTGLSWNKLVGHDAEVASKLRAYNSSSHVHHLDKRQLRLGFVRCQKQMCERGRVRKKWNNGDDDSSAVDVFARVNDAMAVLHDNHRIRRLPIRFMHDATVCLDATCLDDHDILAEYSSDHLKNAICLPSRNDLETRIVFKEMFDLKTHSVVQYSTRAAIVSWANVNHACLMDGWDAVRSFISIYCPAHLTQKYIAECAAPRRPSLLQPHTPPTNGDVSLACMDAYHVVGIFADFLGRTAYNDDEPRDHLLRYKCALLCALTDPVFAGPVDGSLTDDFCQNEHGEFMLVRQLGWRLLPELGSVVVSYMGSSLHGIGDFLSKNIWDELFLPDLKCMKADLDRFEDMIAFVAAVSET